MAFSMPCAWSNFCSSYMLSGGGKSGSEPMRTVFGCASMSACVNLHGYVLGKMSTKQKRVGDILQLSTTGDKLVRHHAKTPRPSESKSKRGMT